MLSDFTGINSRLKFDLGGVSWCHEEMMRLARNTNRGQIFDLERKLLTDIDSFSFIHFILNQLPATFISSSSDFRSFYIMKRLSRHYPLLAISKQTHWWN